MTDGSKRAMILSAPLTHSDWMIHADAPDWGPEGVRTMLDHCRACGWSRIYWRVFDAGMALYASRLLEPMKYATSPQPNCLTTGELASQAPPDLVARAMKLDYHGFDTLAAAVRIGHELGLEIHAWLSINEDDHGWGWPSRFTQAHPECRWVRRDGRAYHSQLSFGFPEVREYKLDLIREMLAYEVDGIFLDWIRTGDIRDNPRNDPQGVANYGYEAPLVESFRSRYGLDPHEVENGDERWVRCRAEPITDFMRTVRNALDQHPRRIVLAGMVHHCWAYRGLQEEGFIDGALRGVLCDIRTWAREGLVDELVVGGYYMKDGTPESGYRWLEEETEGRVALWLYGWVPESTEDFERDLTLARRLGARQLLFWEADYIDMRPEPQREQIMTDAGINLLRMKKLEELLGGALPRLCVKEPVCRTVSSPDKKGNTMEPIEH
ncbi:MAG: family 10 glycosylhydrolase [Candidatus Latescibacterota bacterium]